MTLANKPLDSTNLAKLQAVSARAQSALAATFMEALYSGVEEKELSGYSAEELLGFAETAYRAFERRAPGAPKIEHSEGVLGPVHLVVLDIVNDDMPFLLDSVLNELRTMGLRPELVAHPIFEVVRDASGTLNELRPTSAGANGAVRESFIHLHIRKLDPNQDYERIVPSLMKVLADVRLVVSDFDPIRRRLAEVIAGYEKNPPTADAEMNAELLEFLKWLLDDNFTYLGLREYDFVGEREHLQLVPRDEKGLGLLRDRNVTVLRRDRELERLTAQSRAFFLQSPPIIVSKANAQSSVHRRAHWDSIGIKLYGAAGNITGEVRLAGLFTANTYHMSVRDIPLLRRKMAEVVNLTQVELMGYSGRALAHILETFPRDELFEFAPEELAEICNELLKLDLAPRPRLFIRRDAFERFISAFVYVPREKYSSQVREKIMAVLEEAFQGTCESFTPYYSESPLVRIHFTFWRKEVDLAHPELEELETSIDPTVRTWRDEFVDRVLAEHGSRAFSVIQKYADAFPLGYEETNSATRALKDIQRIDTLTDSAPTNIELYAPDLSAPHRLTAALVQIDEPMPLSRRVPILENMGFRVIAERTYAVHPKFDGARRTVFLHDAEMELPAGEVSFASHRTNLEHGFLAVWRQMAQNDAFNGLILRAGLSWRQAAVLRAYASYLAQTAAPLSLPYLAEVLNKHAGIATDLFAMFDALLNPDRDLDLEQREAEKSRISELIAAKLDKIPTLTEDKIFRSFLALIGATLRTNFYHRGEGGFAPQTIAFKFRSQQIDWLPAPRPYAEIFVTGPRFEGIHLRAAPISRGGLRWSDRPSDFRTEVLGLVKAQQVKNVVIVPHGAKGGFVPRRLPKGDREAVLAEGIACYKSFVSTLLSITDNLKKGTVIPPARTVRRDGDDPYLVVAADKGTATFSDIANAIAIEHDFWLGDAFASGGSAGYDHKKMGITAKGAWEAVKRHFRERNIDIQTTPFTVAGVGDMSGDVFGNGMLLSQAIKLVAAFDHRDIFIDPDPDPAASWKERERLFKLPRSSWQDYDRAKLSPGGAIISRAEKYVSLSPEASKLLGLGGLVTPDEILSAILRLEVDLLWFGGIGTFVRSSRQTNADVGDRANDNVRIPASALRAKVVGEGANLGMTQAARIEYALLGGKCNTDAIDNSAGVNTSDVEVNLKIALQAAMAEGKLTLAERNELLFAMTDEVAEAVLRNNYRQTLAISLSEHHGAAEATYQLRAMQKLEAKGLLDRNLEGLPSDRVFAERQAQGRALTRPELAVLMAYTKIDLESALLASPVPDDPYLARALMDYFPKSMRDRFAEEINNHQLRREIIATALANDIVNRGGITFVVRLIDETGRPASHIAYAFAAAVAVHDAQSLFAAIDALDNQIDSKVQLDLFGMVQHLLVKQTAWGLRHGRPVNGLEAEIEHYHAGIETLATNMSRLLPSPMAERLKAQQASLEAADVPPLLAARLAATVPLIQGPDVIRVAKEAAVSIERAASTVFALREAFRLEELSAASESLTSGEYFDRLAVAATLASISASQRALATSILKGAPDGYDFAAWREENGRACERLARSAAESLDGGALTLAKLTLIAAQLQDLASAPTLAARKEAAAQ